MKAWIQGQRERGRGAAACLSFAVVATHLLIAQKAVGPPKHPVRVPYVGCPSDGQMGPRDAPVGKSRVMALAPRIAQRLAYYEAKESPGVLAPRGWHCMGVYGSNGSALYVSPEQISSAELFSPDWHGFRGPAIELAVSFGDTSGRFEVAKVIARAFPARRDFVQRVIAEAIEPASQFPSQPYPDDVLTYRGQHIVEFLTPAGKPGLGTDSRLQRGNGSIRGVAILVGKTPDLLHLSMRLPDDATDLEQPILKQVER